jgi:hypothetical protein
MKDRGLIIESQKSLEYYVNLFIKSISHIGIGTNGPLTYDDMVQSNAFYNDEKRLSDFFYTGYDEYDNDDRIESTDDKAFYEEYGDCLIVRIWKQYADAMSRRRPDSVLPFENFYYYVISGPAEVFEYEGNYLIGQFRKNLFMVSHFAPKTLRGGMECLREIMGYNNIIFTVTDDLKDMLLKLGIYGNEKASISMFFRGELVKKNILTTNPYIMKQILEIMDTGDFDDDGQELNLNGYDNDIDYPINSNNREPMRYRAKRQKNYNYYYENIMREKRLDRIIQESINRLI